MTITLHYNAACLDCERKANRTSRLDWLNRVQFSTENSPIGQVAKGETVVVDNSSGKTFTGIYATRNICLNVPAYFPYGLILYIPPIRNLFAKSQTGCDGDACQIAAE